MEPDEDSTALNYSQEVTGPKWRARQYLPDAQSLLADIAPSAPEEVLHSWPEHFQLIEESDTAPGLRRPQVGAVHALLGYWTTDPRLPATVVMPTGTGKTDTMVASLVASRAEKLLVIVPSDALRDQLAAKFETLGVLSVLRVLPQATQMPVVGKLSGALQTLQDATNLASVCNVVISTVSALSRTDDDVRKHFASYFSHLFIDEAHHVAADTWRQIRDDFHPKPVVQFTATPHRTDGQHLGGSLIYAFPLREAQRQGYFSKIRYASVLDLLDPDEAIATAALSFLRADRDAGFDHLLMARTNSIRRAEELQDLYARLAPEFKPVVVHSKSGKARSDLAMKLLAMRESRVLICVDMFGEGFDLPQLKIAALHDQHRSLGITLQFIGRFARSGASNLGPATVVAARSEVRQGEALRRLYAEDADWNALVEDLSNRSIEEQTEIDEFTRAFGALPEQVSIHSLTPALSTVVFRPDTLTWDPTKVLELFPESKLLTYPIPINQRDHVLWFVSRESAQPRWGVVQGLDEVVHHLYVVYWDGAKSLLYIHSSNNDSLHENLARQISGDDQASPLSGERVFRVFHDVQRLTPTNVGLLDARNRSRRYSSHVGTDVTEAFPVAEARTKSQTHIAGTGFLEGEKYSIAASLKGRIWSHRTASGLKQWIDWSNVVGNKIIDDSINVDAVMAGFIRPQEIDSWPDLFPLGLELTSRLAEILEEADLAVGDVVVPFYEAELAVGEIRGASTLAFEVRTEYWTRKFVLELSRAGLVVKVDTGSTDIRVIRPRSEIAFTKLATQHGVRVLMSGDSVVEPPGVLLRPNRELPPWPTDRLKIIDWTGINIRKESWGAARDPETVQGRMMALTLEEEWDVVLDDDGSGEVADIVALREIDGTLLVRFVHCKYSSEDLPGARVSDLYELGGQAQRSAKWRRDVDLLIPRLIKRERTRLKNETTGFVRGDIQMLQRLFERSVQLRTSLTVAIAQPGLSAAKVSANQLELLASVDMYVAETAMTSLEVYCNA